MADPCPVCDAQPFLLRAYKARGVKVIERHFPDCPLDPANLTEDAS